MFLNTNLGEKMMYRSRFDSDPSTFEDVFSGSHYKSLTSEYVVVDGVSYPHLFFSDSRDVALGILTDGFQIFRRGPNATCWPIIAINFNLPPTERTHIKNVIPIVIIPGPKSPRHMSSFLRPFIKECKELAVGVRAYDASHHECFDLHVYPISAHADMPAAKHLTELKGPNAYCPCRACEITGVRGEGASVYYVPLGQPKAHGMEELEWDPFCLPMRSQERHGAMLEDIATQTTKTARDDLRQHYGISHISEICELPSMKLFKSFPHEWMHLVLENHLKNLIHLWKGTYKGLNEGKEEYIIANGAWVQIGLETAASSSTIPSSFGRHTPNIWMEQHRFTAKDYAHWILYIAPFVLKDRFPSCKIYKHFMLFHSIVWMTLQYSITQQEVDSL